MGGLAQVTPRLAANNPGLLSATISVMKRSPRKAVPSAAPPRRAAKRPREVRELGKWSMIDGPPVSGRRSRTSESAPGSPSTISSLGVNVPLRGESRSRTPSSVGGAARAKKPLKLSPILCLLDSVPLEAPPAADVDKASCHIGSDCEEDEGESDDDDLRPCEPPPPLPPAALRVMFDFPASSTHRYDASRIPLELIASTVDVEVVEAGPFGRQAVARRPIRAGTVLGWFDGLQLHGDPLLHLHPYSYARTGTSCVIGSPLAWTSYVDDPHGTPAAHNVETKLDLRCVSSAAELRGGPGGSPPPKPRRNMYWPYMRAVADIPAGAPLLVCYGDGYWGDLASRNEVFGRLAALVRALPDPTQVSRSTLRELSERLQRDCDLAPFTLTHWRPLIERIAKQWEAARAPSAAVTRGRRSTGAADRPEQALPQGAWMLPSPAGLGRCGALPPGPPPPAPPPAVREAMFAFPLAPQGPAAAAAVGAAASDVASSSGGAGAASAVVPPPAPPPPVRLTYQPADFRLADVAAPPCIGLWREPDARGGSVVVFARTPIPAGTRLGWFDGLVLPGSSDPLVNLHPYCVTRTESATAGDSIIGSPLHWVTHVGYEAPQHSANVAYDGERRPLPHKAAAGAAAAAGGRPSLRHSVRWPYIFATRDIAAREVLALPSDPGYAAATHERAEVFGALCGLAVLRAAGGRELAPHEIDARLRARFKHAPSRLMLWAPLLARARGLASGGGGAAAAAAPAEGVRKGRAAAAAAAAPPPLQSALSVADDARQDEEGEEEGEASDSASAPNTNSPLSVVSE